MQKTSLPTISPSGLLDFEGCPRRWHETKILKKYKFEVTEAITHGNVVHEQLERYVKFSEALPEHLLYVAPFIEALRHEGYTLYAELECAVTDDWKPVGWWDKTAWLRGKIDLVALNKTTKSALVIDYKTGKRKPDPTQLKIYGAMLMRVLGLKQVDSLYLWLKTNENDRFQITRATLHGIVTEITERIEAMSDAFDRQDFPPRTSPLCGWCPALNDCKEAIYYKIQHDRKRRKS